MNCQPGVIVQSYQLDHGIFAAADFLREIEGGLQNIKFSSVGVDHQNGITKHEYK